jgi:lincosamide nucleotidyltransferase A/C/D/E
VTAETVLELLGLFESQAIDVWLDGGWGVDALLGRQTRPHDDLDLVVALDEGPRILAALGARGFVPEEDERPVRFVMAHSQLGRIDFHTVRFDEGGGGVQPQPGGGTFRYPPQGFTTGRIREHPVRCVSAQTQLLCHLGYEPKEKDVHDVLLLREHFALPLPRAYERFRPSGRG